MCSVNFQPAQCTQCSHGLLELFYRHKPQIICRVDLLIAPQLEMWLIVMWKKTMLSSHLTSAVITFTKPLQRFFIVHWNAVQRNKQRHQQISKAQKVQWSFLRYWKLDQQKNKNKKKNLQQASAKWKWILGKLSDKSRSSKKPETNPASPTTSTNRSPWSPLAAEPTLLGWNQLHVQPSEHLEGRCFCCSPSMQSLHLMRNDPAGLARSSLAGHTMPVMGLWGLGNAGASSTYWCSLVVQLGWELLNI